LNGIPGKGTGGTTTWLVLKFTTVATGTYVTSRSAGASRLAPPARGPGTRETRCSYDLI
jgi:hypothetical protein